MDLWKGELGCWRFAPWCMYSSTLCTSNSAEMCPQHAESSLYSLIDCTDTFRSRSPPLLQCFPPWAVPTLRLKISFSRWIGERPISSHSRRKGSDIELEFTHCHLISEQPGDLNLSSAKDWGAELLYSWIKWWNNPKQRLFLGVIQKCATLPKFSSTYRSSGRRLLAFYQSCCCRAGTTSALSSQPAARFILSNRTNNYIICSIGDVQTRLD